MTRLRQRMLDDLRRPQTIHPTRSAVTSAPSKTLPSTLADQPSIWAARNCAVINSTLLHQKKVALGTVENCARTAYRTARDHW